MAVCASVVAGWLMLVSCGGGQQGQAVEKIESNEGGIKVLDVEKGVEQRDFVNLSKYATEINYIPLETKLDCMMGVDQYTSILKSGERFYFSSWLAEAPLFTFDESGKFLGIVGTKGRAANEYMRRIKSFTADEQSGELVICDVTAKLLFYDSDGNFRISKQIERENRVFDYKLFSVGNREFAFLKEDIYIKGVPQNFGLHKYKKESLVTVNSQGNIVDEKFVGDIYAYIHKTDHGTIGLNYGSPLLYQFDKKLGLLINDSLYHYNPADKSVECRYIVDFGKYYLGDESKHNAIISGGNALFFETGNFILFSVLFPYSAFPEMPNCYRFSTFVFDKKSGDIQALEDDPIFGAARLREGGSGFAGFTNDLDGGAPFVPRYIKDGKMYELMDAIRFIEQAQKSKSNKMKRVAASLTEDSNPILIEVVLK